MDIAVPNPPRLRRRPELRHAREPWLGRGTETSACSARHTVSAVVKFAVAEIVAQLRLTTFASRNGAISLPANPKEMTMTYSFQPYKTQRTGARLASLWWIALS